MTESKKQVDQAPSDETLPQQEVQVLIETSDAKLAAVAGGPRISNDDPTQ